MNGITTAGPIGTPPLAERGTMPEGGNKHNGLPTLVINLGMFATTIAAGVSLLASGTGSFRIVLPVVFAAVGSAVRLQRELKGRKHG